MTLSSNTEMSVHRAGVLGCVVIRSCGLGIFALVAAVAIAAGCSGDDDPTSTPTGTPEVAGTPEVTGTPEASPPAEGTTTATVEATSEATATPWRNGVMLLDVSGVGDHWTLYDGESRMVVGDPPAPRFAADGSVWLRAGEWPSAVQFARDGAELASIEGAWGVSTTADGSRRAYYRGDGDAAPELVVETDLGTEVIPGPIRKHEFSSDGTRVAYYRADEAGLSSLYVLDLASGETTMLASSIDPCQCEWTSGPVWSPSGVTLAFEDYGQLLGPDDPTRGQYVVLASGGEPVDVGVFAGWLPGGAADLAVTERDGEVRVIDVTTGDSRLLMSAPEGRSVRVRVLAGRALVQARMTESSTADTITVLIDALTGDELARWELWGVPTLTPTGPAIFALGGQNQRAGAPFCNGLAVVQAELAEPACVTHANFGIWSPDGTRLLVSGNSRESTDDWVGVWSVDAGLETRFDVPPRSALADWSADGETALVVWGFGP